MLAAGRCSEFGHKYSVQLEKSIDWTRGGYHKDSWNDGIWRLGVTIVDSLVGCGIDHHDKNSWTEHRHNDLLQIFWWPIHLMSECHLQGTGWILQENKLWSDTWPDLCPSWDPEHVMSCIMVKTWMQHLSLSDLLVISFIVPRPTTIRPWLTPRPCQRRQSQTYPRNPLSVAKTGNPLSQLPPFDSPTCCQPPTINIWKGTGGWSRWHNLHWRLFMTTMLCLHPKKAFHMPSTLSLCTCKFLLSFVIGNDTADESSDLLGLVTSRWWMCSLQVLCWTLQGIQNPCQTFQRQPSIMEF